MPLLDEISRKKIRSRISKRISEARSGINLTKPELDAAIAAVDQWIEDNQASFNNSLPEPAKTNLSGNQKVLLFFYVANERFEVL
jgi:hypothetical protein